MTKAANLAAAATNIDSSGILGVASGGTGLSSPGASGNALVSNGTSWTSGSVTPFPAGTALIFAQTSAPTGWTKSTTHNDKALRVVSGTAGSGGTVAFTTAFASQAVSGTIGVTGSTTLTTAQIPGHTHNYSGNTGTISADHSHSMGGTYQVYGAPSISAVLTAISSQNTGGVSANHTHAYSGTTDGGSVSGGSHNHTGGTFTGTAINLAVQYVDVIIATKD